MAKNGTVRRPRVDRETHRPAISVSPTKAGMPPLSIGVISGRRKTRIFSSLRSVATAMSIVSPPSGKPYATSMLFIRPIPVNVFSGMIFPSRSKTKIEPPLSVPRIRLWAGSSGLIQIAGSSESTAVCSVITTGAIALGSIGIAISTRQFLRPAVGWPPPEHAASSQDR